MNSLSYAKEQILKIAKRASERGCLNDSCLIKCKYNEWMGFHIHEIVLYDRLSVSGYAQYLETDTIYLYDSAGWVKYRIQEKEIKALDIKQDIKMFAFNTLMDLD